MLRNHYNPAIQVIFFFPYTSQVDPLQEVFLGHDQLFFSNSLLQSIVIGHRYIDYYSNVDFTTPSDYLSDFHKSRQLDIFSKACAC